MSPHGTRSRQVAGCRCDLCREAHRAYMERWRRARGVQPIVPSPHGARNRYRKGCRCDLCRAANTAAVRKWREKKRAS